MRAGRLRHRIMFQQSRAGRDSVGQPSIEWVDAYPLSIWAEVKSLSGNKRLSASAEQSETTTLIVIRYRPGITADMRIVHRPPTGCGEVYTILSIIPDPKRTQIELMCSEGVIK